jgi:hypothetical protein
MTTFTDVESPRPVMTDDQLRLLAYVQAHPTPRPEPERDHYGRYKLVDPKTGKVRGWTRATTLAGTIDDTYSLTKWANRMVAVGVATNPGIADQLARLDDPHGAHKGDAQRLADQAKALAGASLSAEIGTAIHCLTEHFDLDTEIGRDLSPVGEPWVGDVLAYAAALHRAGIDVPAEWVERIVIVPDLGVAGTLDRIVTLPDGRNVILDVKTGSSIDHGLGSIAAQLAIYSRASHMWTGDGYQLMPAVDQSMALVAHMPAGTNTCTLHEVDIERGWELAQLCATVRDARKWGRKLGLVHGAPSPLGRRETTEADIVSRTKRIATESPELVPALRLAWDAIGIAKQPPWTPSEVEALDAMLLDVEMPEARMVAAPEPVAAPTAEPAEPAPLVALPVPTDGEEPTDPTGVQLGLTVMAADEPLYLEGIKAWGADSRASGQPWQATVRGEAQTFAAMQLYRAAFAKPAKHQGQARVRAILAYVTQNDTYLDARHTVGACIGSLTVPQAVEARLVAESWTSDKALRDLISGIADEAATGEHTNPQAKAKAP